MLGVCPLDIRFQVVSIFMLISASVDKGDAFILALPGLRGDILLDEMNREA